MFILAECNIPGVITGILSQLYRIIIILVPIGIVVFGSIDFIKATIAKDANAIASSTKTFISRLIAGAVTFFVLTIVTWLFTIIIGHVGGASSAMQCALEIIGGTASDYTGGNSYSSQMTNKMACYGTQYSLCIRSIPNTNNDEMCRQAADEACGTNISNNNNSSTNNNENNENNETNHESSGGNNMSGSGSGGHR